MTRIAIVAALPGELKPLVRSWSHEKRDGVSVWTRRREGSEWVAACCGAGQNAATRAFEAISALGPIDEVVSAGWAGALSQHCCSGQAYDISTVVDARTGERFHAGAAIEGCRLVTSAKVAGESEKRRLASTYGAALVDMEAAAVGRLAAMRGIPFFCIKGVSDGYKDRLPDFNRFLDSGGQLKLVSLILFALMRPWHWPALVKMGENSRKAAQSIAQSLLEFLEERGQIKKQNGNPSLER